MVSLVAFSTSTNINNNLQHAVTKTNDKEEKGWLKWSVDITSNFAIAASDSLHRILPDSILLAIGSPSRQKNVLPSKKVRSRPLRTALETIRAIKSALTQDRQDMFDVAIAELAPFPSASSSSVMFSTTSSSDIPVIEIRFGKECAHVPICDDADEIADLTLVRLYELVTLSFPTLCTKSSSSSSSSSIKDTGEKSFIIRCRVQDLKDKTTFIWIEAKEDEDIRRAITTGLRSFEKRVAAVTTTSTKEEEEEEAGDAPVFVSASRCVGIFEVVTREELRLQKEKLRQISRHKRRLFRGQLSLLRRKVEAVYSMIRDPNAAFWPKILSLSALAYVVSPIDAIPDAIPVLGLADDFAVLTALFASLASMSVDIEKYESSRSDSVSQDEKNSTTATMSGGGDFEMTSAGSNNGHTKKQLLKRSGSNASLNSEIDSDFDFDEFHDIEDDYVELEKSDAWNESEIFL